jgi:hypothetical protein
MLRVDRLVVAGLHTAVPFQLVPPFLLAVAAHHLVAANHRQFPEAPAASDSDGLEVGRIYSREGGGASAWETWPPYLSVPKDPPNQNFYMQFGNLRVIIW